MEKNERFLEENSAVKRTELIAEKLVCWWTKRNVTMILAGPEGKENMNATLYKSETDQTSKWVSL